MKTKVFTSVILVAALSITFTACENDTLNELETKKATIEQIKPIDNHNDRDFRLDELKKLPVRREIKPSFTPPAKDKNNRETNKQTLEEMPVRKESKKTPGQRISKEIEPVKVYSDKL